MSTPGEAAGLLEHLLFEMAKGVSGQTGGAFFHSLVRHLADSLPADFVFVGLVQPGGKRIQTLAAYRDGAEIPAEEYDLEGTPYAEVLEKRLCCYPSGVPQMFPQDLRLMQMGAEGFVGSAMVDSSGQCVGLVCAITRRPLKPVKVAEVLLQLIAIHAITELQRKNSEDALAVSEKRLRALVTHGVELLP